MEARTLDPVLAIAALVARTGATEFEIGYQHDETDPEGCRGCEYERITTALGKPKPCPIHKPLMH